MLVVNPCKVWMTDFGIHLLEPQDLAAAAAHR
jgi:hypothetical protein